MKVSSKFLSLSFFFSLIASGLGISACGEKNFSLSSVEQTLAPPLEAPNEAQKIISDRPLSPQPFIATLKLNEPALLEVAIKKGSKIIIPEEAQAAVLSEQERVIKRLKSLGPNVQVLYRYRMILNGLAVAAPGELAEDIEKIAGIAKIERRLVFPRPDWLKKTSGTTSPATPSLDNINPVGFLGAFELHKAGFSGQGMRVGVIDTGIDYTHKMLGGSGSPSEFKSVDPKSPSSLFPNSKVVGGMDFVGTEFDAGSVRFSQQVPQPDMNPIDEAAHGTHVAGTVAGIGDGVETYSGVAPDAKLFALKVFGKNGSTADYVVVAALEYAADPDGDGQPNDRLDVVNLSLGGGFGLPKILYTEAISNLTKGGTIVVAAAGNSGPTDYIVGAPGTSNDALSVGASVDNMPHNWTFPAVEFTSKSKPSLLARGIEGPASKPIKEVGRVSADLVAIGFAGEPLPEDLKKAVNGKVALIDRGGKIPFVNKLKTAKAAGAVAAVVANNEPGKPFAMGGEGSVDIPAVMVSLEMGTEIKKLMKTESVTAHFGTGQTVEDPSLIDSIADFSSKGPRSSDSALKPEISAPGENVISALMGSGIKGVKFSGTSMASPHIAGVMALLRQKFPNETPQSLKALVMNTAKILRQNGTDYPWSLQGAGRVQIDRAAVSPLIIEEGAIALGNLQVGTQRTLKKVLTLRNLSQKPIHVDFNSRGPAYLKALAPNSIDIGPLNTVRVPVYIQVSRTPIAQSYVEINSSLDVTAIQGSTQTQLHVPVLAMFSTRTQIKVDQLDILGGPKDSVESVARLSLSNDSDIAGEAYVFNLLALDDTKPIPGRRDSYRMVDCDLEAVGYRIVKRLINGQFVDIFQLAAKVREPLTSWLFCEISVQIDTNNDNLADQELAGVYSGVIAGYPGFTPISTLLDAVKAREIRQRFEQSLASGKVENLDYKPATLAVGPMKNYDHSTLAIVETPLEALNLRRGGELAIKVAALSGNSEAFEADDFLGNSLNQWITIDPRPSYAPFKDLPEVINLGPRTSTEVEFSRGVEEGQLVVFMPRNSAERTRVSTAQMEVMRPRYQAILKVK